MLEADGRKLIWSGGFVMGGPAVVPGYSRAYPAYGGIRMYSIVVHRGIYMYSIIKVSKLRFFTIFSPWAYPALESWVRHWVLYTLFRDLSLYSDMLELENIFIVLLL